MSTSTRDPGVAEREFTRLVNGAADKLEAGERPPDISRASIWHSPSQPLEVAHRYGDGLVAAGHTPRFWALQWWTYTGTHYIVWEDHEITGRLYQTLRHAEYRDAHGDLVPWNPDQAKTNKVIHALKTPPRLIRATVRPGSWLQTDHGLVIPCRRAAEDLRPDPDAAPPKRPIRGTASGGPGKNVDYPKPRTKGGR